MLFSKDATYYYITNLGYMLDNVRCYFDVYNIDETFTDFKFSQKQNATLFIVSKPITAFILVLRVGGSMPSMWL